MNTPIISSQLYFEAPGARDVGSDSRRALLVSWSFPPDPEVGGLRWQQMVRHFAARGWTFDVLTKDFRGVKGLDLARLETLPAGTRVFSVPASPPFILRLHRAVRRLLDRVRQDAESPANAPDRGTRTGGGNARHSWRMAVEHAYNAWVLFARDGKWARAAARAGAELTKSEDYRVVISSGPPHMAHEAARLIAHRAKLPFVVDMRDPWSLVQRSGGEITSPVWKFLAGRYERRVASGAALITMNTEPAADAMRSAYPQHSGKIEVIRNGCDDEPLPVPRREGRFTIRFAGSIYIDRDPRLVFRAAARLIGELGLTPDRFAIEFVGDVDKFGATPTMQIAREEGVEAFVTLRGLVKRAEALSFLAGASMLLSLPQDSDFAIPAKIYEYLRFDAWMLVLAHKASATGRLLEGTGADVVDPADVDGMARVLRRRFEQFSRGERPVAVGQDGGFSRRLQAEKLLSLLESKVLPLNASPRRLSEMSAVVTGVAAHTAQWMG